MHFKMLSCLRDGAVNRIMVKSSLHNKCKLHMPKHGLNPEVKKVCASLLQRPAMDDVSAAERGGCFFFKKEDRLPEGGLVEGPWQTVGGGRSGPAGRVEAVMAKRCEEGAAR